MDIASYHSRQMSRVPGVSSTNLDSEFLVDIFLEETYKTNQLLEIIRTFNCQKSYVSDNSAAEQDFLSIIVLLLQLSSFDNKVNKRRKCKYSERSFEKLIYNSFYSFISLYCFYFFYIYMMGHYNFCVTACFEILFTCLHRSSCR